MWATILDNLPEQGLPWTHLAKSIGQPYDENQLKVSRVILNRITQTIVPSEKEEQIAIKVLLSGQTEVFLLTFNTWISITKPSWKRDFLMKVIDSWINKGNYLNDLLFSHCKPRAGHLSTQLIKVLTTIPDLVANCYKYLIPKQFTTDVYFKRLCQVIDKVCDIIHSKLTISEGNSVVILSNLIGRISFLSHSDILWSNLLQPLVLKSTNDMIYRRIVLKIMDNQQDIHIESLVRVILSNCSNYFQVDCFLSDSINRNNKLEYLLTEKFVLISYNYSEKTSSNLIGYLAKQNVKLLIKVINTCLDIWSSKSSVENRNIQQNLYIYSLMIHAFQVVPQSEIETNSTTWLKVLMKGIEMYLNQVTLVIRNCGLFIGKCLITKVEPKFSESLDFPIEDDVNVIFLKKCLNNQSEKVNDAINHEAIAQVSKVQPLIEELNCDDTSRINESTSNDVDLDPECDIKKPKYLNDCLEGLGDTDNYEWGQECLKSLKDLLFSNEYAAREMSIEITKRILMLTNSDYDSDEYIQNSLVAICAISPIEVSSYLIGKVYDRSFSMSTRLQILHVLGMAAFQIAFGVRSTSTVTVKSQSNEFTFKNIHPVSIETIEAIEETWSVNDSELSTKIPKTRKLTSKTKFIVGKKNPFTQYAGHFFYPLIEKFDGTDIILTVESFDVNFLVNLIYTLGIILHASSQIWESRKMGKTLLPFIFPLKDHKEPMVRRAVLFALTNILTSVPIVYLFEELNQFVQLFKTWLIQVIEDDVDYECKLSAKKCVYVLNDLIDSNSRLKN